MQKMAGITSLFRGVSKDDPTKVCAVMKAESGVMEAFIADNADLIASSGHVLESTVAQVFLEGSSVDQSSSSSRLRAHGESCHRQHGAGEPFAVGPPQHRQHRL